jgi:hypothetical protein
MDTMRNPRSAIPILVLLVALLLAGCGGSAASVAPTTAPAAAPAAPAATAAPMAMPAAEPTVALAAPAAEADAAGGGQPAATPAPGSVAASDPSRKIIKDAQLTLEVPSVQLALSRISGAVAQVGGYTLETSTNYGQQNTQQALIKVAVPVDQFEATLQRIREAAGRVISEQASGVDATQEYVDVQSQIANLEATQARIRQFLDQATTVEEALQVNAQLTEIEGQISQYKGRLQFLAQRAAYSTISVQLQEPPPPTATPSPTPSPTPTPTPEPFWNPSKTATQATSTLTTIVQAIMTVALWLLIVVLPLALPIVLIVLIVRALRRRGVRAKAQPTKETTEQGK